jgi:carbamoylphosphate synthase small subunit
VLYCAENGRETDLIRRAALALADGTVLEGVGFGADIRSGEKSFSTAEFLFDEFLEATR